MAGLLYDNIVTPACVCIITFITILMKNIEIIVHYIHELTWQVVRAYLHQGVHTSMLLNQFFYYLQIQENE